MCDKWQNWRSQVKQSGWPLGPLDMANHARRDKATAPSAVGCQHAGAHCARSGCLPCAQVQPCHALCAHTMHTVACVPRPQLCAGRAQCALAGLPARANCVSDRGLVSRGLYFPFVDFFPRHSLFLEN